MGRQALKEFSWYF